MVRPSSRIDQDSFPGILHCCAQEPRPLHSRARDHAFAHHKPWPRHQSCRAGNGPAGNVHVSRPPRPRPVDCRCPCIARASGVADQQRPGPRVLYPACPLVVSGLPPVVAVALATRDAALPGNLDGRPHYRAADSRLAAHITPGVARGRGGARGHPQRWRVAGPGAVAGAQPRLVARGDPRGARDKRPWSALRVAADALVHADHDACAPATGHPHHVFHAVRLLSAVPAVLTS